MLHTTAQERYKKLKKLFSRLMADFNRDDLDDFIAVANSLPEYIKNDARMSQEQKDAVEHFKVPNGVDWQICHETANRQKHFGVKRGATVVNARVQSDGTGFMLPETMEVLASGEDIVFECNWGNESASAFVIRTFKTFHYIFEMAPIPLHQRKIPSFADLLA